MTNRWTVATLAFAALILFPVEHGSAIVEGDSTEVTSNGGVIRANLIIRAGASTPRGSSDGGADGGYVDPTCGWTNLSVNDPSQAETVGGVRFNWWVQACGTGQNPRTTRYLVQQLTPGEVLPGMVGEIEGQIHPPETEFQDLEPGFGWTYVKKSTDFRITNLTPLLLTRTITAGPASLSITVTATPTVVRFYPNEPGSYAMACSAADAQAVFVLGQHGRCAYTYSYSSALAPNHRTFDTWTQVDWDIAYTSTLGEGSLDPFTSRSTKPLAVAEIQAVVTCVGPLPEQGGC